MDQEEVTAEETPKKSVRRKTASKTTANSSTVSGQTNSTLPNIFIDLIGKISEAEAEFNRLQKEIEETEQNWLKEQKDHEQEKTSRNTQEELERKRAREDYEYEMARKRKMAEDEFNDKKAAWEKQLRDNQEQINKDKQELEQLKKLAANFEAEKEKITKEAQEQLEIQLNQKFEFENRLKDQEFKAEKEILNLKIANLQAENSRQMKELDLLKKALDEATRQVKEIAVKVIEAGNTSKSPATLEA